MTTSTQLTNPGLSFLNNVLSGISRTFSGVGAGAELFVPDEIGDAQRQALKEVNQLERDGKLPQGVSKGEVYNYRLEQIVAEKTGRKAPPVAPGTSKGTQDVIAAASDLSGSNVGSKNSDIALKPEEKPVFQDSKRTDRYTGDPQAGKDVTTGPKRMSDFYQFNYDLLKEQFDRLPGLIDQQNKAELERIAATSAAAKERETIAQWAATERAMIQRDAAMALGLMNTAYLANTPNVSLIQQLNAPLAAVAPNYKLPLPGGNK